MGRHRGPAPGVRRRVAVRDELVAAGAGGVQLGLVGGQSCWLLLCFAQRSQPPGGGAGAARSGSLPGRLRLAGTEPGGRWRAAGGELLGCIAGGSSPAGQRCSGSGFSCAASLGWCFVSAPLNPPFVTDGRLDGGGGVSGGGSQRERSG